MQKVIEAFLAVIPGSENIIKGREIAAISALYIFWTFAATGAASSAGLGASRKEGLDNNRELCALEEDGCVLRCADFEAS